MAFDRDSKGRFLKNGNLGERHPLWKADKVGYIGLHGWVARHLKKEKCCECGSRDNLDYANISGKYKRDLSDWQVMCKRCHHIFDDVYTKMMTTRRKNGSRFVKGNAEKYICKICKIECSDGHPSVRLCKKHYLNRYYQMNKWRYKK